MIRSGRFDPREMISHRGSLAEVNALIEIMRCGAATHAMILFPD